jgi:hypothetical protein
MHDNFRKYGIAGREIFQISLVTYLILLILETIRTGIITHFININYIIPVIILSGIMMTLWDKEEYHLQKKKRLGELDIYYIAALSLGAGLLVWYKTSDLGWISIAISICTTLITILLALLIFLEDNSDKT